MDNIERTKQYYTTQRELRGPLLTDDFKFIEASNHPIPGEFAGLAGLLDIVPRFLKMFDIEDWRIKEYTSGGDYTVALMEMWSPDIDGTRLHLEVAEVFHWQDGKLHEVKPFWFDMNKLNRAIAAKKHRESRAK